MTEHLRVNGVYWGLTALCIMGHQDALPREEMVDYVLECWDDEAGQFSTLKPQLPSTTITLMTLGPWECMASKFS